MVSTFFVLSRHIEQYSIYNESDELTTMEKDLVNDDVEMIINTITVMSISVLSIFLDVYSNYGFGKCCKLNLLCYFSLLQLN